MRENMEKSMLFSLLACDFNGCYKQLRKDLNIYKELAGRELTQNEVRKLFTIITGNNCIRYVLVSDIHLDYKHPNFEDTGDLLYISYVEETYDL